MLVATINVVRQLCSTHYTYSSQIPSTYSKNVSTAYSNYSRFLSSTWNILRFSSAIYKLHNVRDIFSLSYVPAGLAFYPAEFARVTCLCCQQAAVISYTFALHIFS